MGGAPTRSARRTASTARSSGIARSLWSTKNCQILTLDLNIPSIIIVTIQRQDLLLLAHLMLPCFLAAKLLLLLSGYPLPCGALVAPMAREVELGDERRNGLQK